MQRRTTKTRQHQACFTHGFTLVELLAVVSIIVLLMAILLPATQRALDVAQMAVCASNMRGLGTATFMYTGDNFQVYPTAHFAMQWKDYDGGNSAYSWHSWHTDTFGQTGIQPTDASQGGHPGGQLWKYTNNEKLYMCPTYIGTMAQPTPAGDLGSHGEAERSPGVSYTMHAGIGETRLTWWDWSLRRRTGPWDNLNGTNHVYLPADTLLYAEENLQRNREFAGGGRNDMIMLAGIYANPGFIVDSIGDFHVPSTGTGSLRGRSNVLFGDGHVGQHHPSETKALSYPGMLIN